MFYTIQNNGLIIAEKEQSLTRFYDNVFELPADYEDEKYIVDDGELVLNPNYEQEQAQKQIEERKNEIKIELEELDKKRIRALAEPSLRDDGTSWLAYYNSQVEILRTEFSLL